MVRSLSQASVEHEQFFKQLEGAASRFGVVADYFGRGLFNKVLSLSGVCSLGRGCPKFFVGFRSHCSQATARRVAGRGQPWRQRQ